MISVIICSIDDKKFFKVSQNYAELLEHEPFEIIRIPDAKSLAEGYNRGIAQSSGSILIFSHDDIEILSPDFAQKLKFSLANCDVLGVAGTSRLVNALWTAAWQPYIHGVVICPSSTSSYVINVYGVEGPLTPDIQALDGLFFAVNRTVVDKIQFDPTTFDGFHCYDLDFTYQAYLSGLKISVSNEIIIIHESVGGFDKNWEKYGQRFMEKYRGKLVNFNATAERIACAPVSTKEKILDYCQLPALIHLTKRMRAR